VDARKECEESLYRIIRKIEDVSPAPMAQPQHKEDAHKECEECVYRIIRKIEDESPAPMAQVVAASETSALEPAGLLRQQLNREIVCRDVLVDLLMGVEVEMETHRACSDAVDRLVSEVALAAQRPPVPVVVTLVDETDGDAVRATLDAAIAKVEKKHADHHLHYLKAAFAFEHEVHKQIAKQEMRKFKKLMKDELKKREVSHMAPSDFFGTGMGDVEFFVRSTEELLRAECELVLKDVVHEVRRAHEAEEIKDALSSAVSSGVSSPAVVSEKAQEAIEENLALKKARIRVVEEIGRRSRERQAVLVIQTAWRARMGLVLGRVRVIQGWFKRVVGRKRAGLVIERIAELRHAHAGEIQKLHAELAEKKRLLDAAEESKAESAAGGLEGLLGQAAAEDEVKEDGGLEGLQGQAAAEDDAEAENEVGESEGLGSTLDKATALEQAAAAQKKTDELRSQLAKAQEIAKVTAEEKAAQEAAREELRRQLAEAQVAVAAEEKARSQLEEERAAERAEKEEVERHLREAKSAQEAAVALHQAAGENFKEAGLAHESMLQAMNERLRLLEEEKRGLAGQAESASLEKEQLDAAIAVLKEKSGAEMSAAKAELEAAVEAKGLLAQQVEGLNEKIGEAGEAGRRLEEKLREAEEKRAREEKLVADLEEKAANIAKEREAKEKAAEMLEAKLEEAEERRQKELELKQKEFEERIEAKETDLMKKIKENNEVNLLLIEVQRLADERGAVLKEESRMVKESIEEAGVAKGRVAAVEEELKASKVKRAELESQMEQMRVNSDFKHTLDLMNDQLKQANEEKERLLSEKMAEEERERERLKEEVEKQKLALEEERRVDKEAIEAKMSEMSKILTELQEKTETKAEEMVGEVVAVLEEKKVAEEVPPGVAEKEQEIELLRADIELYEEKMKKSREVEVQLKRALKTIISMKRKQNEEQQYQKSLVEEKEQETAEVAERLSRVEGALTEVEGELQSTQNVVLSVEEEKEAVKMKYSKVMAQMEGLEREKEKKARGVQELARRMKKQQEEAAEEKEKLMKSLMRVKKQLGEKGGLEEELEGAREEMRRVKEELRREQMERKIARNAMFDMQGKIRVFVRCRPLVERE
jgi:hypothetical protein